MNILITSNTYYPCKDGVQFVTQYLAEGLVSKGHKVLVITYKKEWITDLGEEFHNGVHIIRWNAKTVHTIHKGEKRKFQEFVLTKQNEYDVMVNVGTQTALTDWLLPIYRYIHIPKYLYIHSIWDFKINKNDLSNVRKISSKIWANIRWSIYFVYYSKAFKSYDLVSQLHSRDYSCRFFKKKYGIESIVIENAVDEVFLESQGIEKKAHYIIYVANYFPGKNQKRCLDLFYKCRNNNGWKLILIGSTKTEYYYQINEYNNELKQKYGLEDSVEILVDIQRQEVCEYIKGASLFVMTSDREAYPISILEAMAASVPYVSTDVGIVKYLPGGKTGRYDDELVEAMELFMNNQEMRDRYGMDGYEYVKKHCDKQKQIELFEKYLEQIAKKE